MLAREALPGAALEIAPIDGVLEALQTRFDLVLIDASAAPAPLLMEAIESLARRPVQPGVLLTGAHLPAGLVRTLMKLRRSDVVESPFVPADLARAAAGLVEAAPQAASPSCRCWSVMGAVGGAGATTIAIELAAAMAKRAGRDRKVALIDLNLADGAAAAYLGASSNMLLSGASLTPERIDASILGAFAAPLDWGLDLFASPRDPQAFTRVDPAAVCRVLEVACQVYEWIVVDLPRLRQPWTLDVLAGGDETLIVSELTVPALLSARALAGEIEMELSGAKPPRLVLNRLSSRAFGPAPSQREAEKALQRKVDGAITSDWEAAACSVNLGGPISHHRPRSKIVKDIATLVDRLGSQAADSMARAG
ncbi:MAG: hypothetical protein WDM92_16865 [Caulobacteraceae bacterium]